MRIAAIEPYAALSHSAFLEGLRAHSAHEIVVLSLPARTWKWRMRTSAIHFAARIEEEQPFDAFFVSDYLNLAELQALLPARERELPACVYFHENQLTYPRQPHEPLDIHFGLTHLYSVLAARRALFNSNYHLTSFYDALQGHLASVPDIDMGPSIANARAKSSVLPIGTDVELGHPREPGSEVPVILWNHRWEYDKDPDAFVDALIGLERDGVEFRVRTLGQRFRSIPAAYERMRTELGERVIDDGFLARTGDYRRALASAHIVASTARHEFFGLGTLEALRTGLFPVLPDDLAYPELVPSETRELFLYDRREGVKPALERALETVRAGDHLAQRADLVASTNRFSWPPLADRYDRSFESLVAGD